MIFNISFSPTGGTMKVSEIIAKSFKDDTILIDLTDSKYEFSTVSISSDDISVISVPAFGGRVPVPAAERLRAINGNGSRAILIATYGTRAIDDTLLELDELTRSSGFKPIAGIEAVTEHSLIRDYGEGRPNDNDKTELKDFAYKIIDNISRLSPPDFPGNYPYKDFPGCPAKPTSSSGCIACGLCRKYCPVEAIPNDDIKSVDRSKCISCMRCITLCPVESRKYPVEIWEKINKMLTERSNPSSKNRLYISIAQ